MPVPTDITAGTLTITNGSTAVTGVGTSWLASDLRQGDVILWIEGGDGFQTPILADVPSSNTALVLAEPWQGPTLTGVRYRIRYQWDSSRVSAQSRQLIELLDNGNILALASLTGPGVPVFDGPHSMTVRPTQDFINGVAYDVQVDTLADRAAYDGQAAGFSVLVSDVGDGRSAVYSKASNTSGDWTAPAYVTGPVGPLPGVEATVTTGAPGSAATVDEVPITGGVRLDFTLPSAEGFYNAGVYDGGTAYTTDQVVRHNGSSFIALQAVPAGTSPSSAFPPVDTAYWQVLAAKGNDGAGTVTALSNSDGVTIDATDPTTPIIGLEPFGVGAIGAVPPPTSADVTDGDFLRADGQWAQAGDSFDRGVTGSIARRPAFGLLIGPDYVHAREFVNCDGTDETTKLQNAINAARNKRLILPSGEIRISASMNFLNSTNFEVVGFGKDPNAANCSRIRNTGVDVANSHTFVMNNGGMVGVDLHREFSHFTLIGNRYSADHMHLAWAAGVNIHDVWLTTTGGRGLYAYRTWSAVVRDSVMTHCGRQGLHFQEEANKVLFENVWVNGNAKNGETGDNAVGFHIQGSAGAENLGVQILNCDWTANGVGNGWVGNTNNPNSINFAIQHTWGADIRGNYAEVTPNILTYIAASCRGITFSNNYMQDGQCIVESGALGIIAEGNIFRKVGAGATIWNALSSQSANACRYYANQLIGGATKTEAA